MPVLIGVKQLDGRAGECVCVIDRRSPALLQRLPRGPIVSWLASEPGEIVYNHRQITDHPEWRETGIQVRVVVVVNTSPIACTHTRCGHMHTKFTCQQVNLAYSLRCEHDEGSFSRGYPLSTSSNGIITVLSRGNRQLSKQRFSMLSGIPFHVTILWGH